MLSHRGPDHSGIYSDSFNLSYIVHNRLTIQDPSPNANQPMVSPCRRYVLVFNGEIYNHNSLRRSVQLSGIHQSTCSDTEVLLTLLILHGANALPMLNGMFAFVFIDYGPDLCTPQVLLARDRLGTKPLFYGFSQSSLYFASELKAIPSIFRHGPCPFALNEYLAKGYISAPRTIDLAISKVSPAHYLLWDSKRSDRFPCATQWWTLPTFEQSSDIYIEEHLESIEYLLKSSVYLRSQLSVPSAVSLSGGLDSLLILSLLAEQSNSPIRTFTASFHGSSLDESEHALMVSKYFGTNHESVELGVPDLDLLHQFSSLIDEPLADSSLLPSYAISRAASKNSKVIFSGDGGDELFGGYNEYIRASILSSRLAPISPYPNLYNIMNLCANLIPIGMPGRNFLQSLKQGPYQQIIWGTPYFDAISRSLLLKPSLQQPITKTYREMITHFDHGDNPLDSMMRLHFHDILPNDFLFKADCASMYSSIEARSPLLDYRLFEYMYSTVPESLKLSGQTSRILQRMLLKRRLPSHLIAKRKQGFSIPISQWFATNNPQINSILSELPSNLFNHRFVQYLLSTQRYLSFSNTSRLYSLLILRFSLNNLYGI